VPVRHHAVERRARSVGAVDLSATPGAAERPEAGFSARSRATILSDLAERPLDLLVIGGGINGAGIAREAALRGLRVGLLDKGDFGGGTSSRSSKLIHGGLRYLELGDLRLVFEACQERDLLRRRLAPHLVRPLPFLFPVYAGDPRGLLAISAGLWLYDVLATFRNIRWHRRLSARATLRLEPGLRRENLRGAGYYYDCWTDDARLTLETILSAWEEGALACNYVEVVGFRKTLGWIDGVEARDVLGGQRIAVRASVVVNAAGPWVDVVRKLDAPEAAPLLRLTKGVHVVLPRERIGNTQAVVIRAPADGRVMFVIPWESHDLVGTTDTDHDGVPDVVRPDRADVDYLLEAVNHYFPAAAVKPHEVVSAFAGLRPLVAPQRTRDAAPSAVSREEVIVVSPHGLVSLAGGKLTTYRRTAITVVERVVAELQRRGDRRRFPKSRSHRKPLVGAVPANGGPAMGIDGHLAARYGRRTVRLQSVLDEQSGLRELLAPPLEDLRGEVSLAAREEMAVRLEDVLRRRLHVALRHPSQGLEVAGDVAAIMAEVLGWDEARRRQEEDAYRRRVMEERLGWAPR
jgi:glycerol-3-phosphate dehydrogenase